MNWKNNPFGFDLFAFRPLSGKQKKMILCALCDSAVKYYVIF